MTRTVDLLRAFNLLRALGSKESLVRPKKLDIFCYEQTQFTKLNSSLGCRI